MIITKLFKLGGSDSTRILIPLSKTKEFQNRQQIDKANERLFILAFSEGRTRDIWVPLEDLKLLEVR